MDDVADRMDVDTDSNESHRTYKMLGTHHCNDSMNHCNDTCMVDNDSMISRQPFILTMIQILQISSFHVMLVNSFGVFLSTVLTDFAFKVW